MDKKYGWLTKRQGQNLNTVPTQVFVWHKILFMLDLNCLQSNELCLHKLVKWLFKWTCCICYKTQKINFERPCNTYVWKIIEQYWLNLIVLNKGWILYLPALTKSILEAFVKYVCMHSCWESLHGWMWTQAKIHSEFED